MPSEYFKQWKGQAAWLQRYWSLYGGWRALLTSPYPQVAGVIALITNICSAKSFDPFAITISVVPSILGFTVSALAIILAFSSSQIFRYLAQGGRDDSLFMKTIANFVHFIALQIAAVIIAVIGASHDFTILRFFVTFLFVYAILTTMSVVIQLFQMALLFNKSNIDDKDT